MSDSLLPTLGTILALALLEAVLSADNAVAIAALVRDLEPPELRNRALNGGLVAAFVLRLLVIVLAAWVVRYPQVQLLGGVYLLVLAWRHFQEQLSPEAEDAGERPGRGLSLAAVIGLVAVTDLAFSLDSVTAAVAVTDRTWLVVVGGGMGVLMLRFLAGWVLLWMERFVNLQNAAYLTVMAVGLRLVARVAAPQLAPSEPLLLTIMVVFFLWGFIGASAAIGAEAPLLPAVGAGTGAAGDAAVAETCGDGAQPLTSSPNSGTGVWITPACTSPNTTSV